MRKKKDKKKDKKKFIVELFVQKKKKKKKMSKTIEVQWQPIIHTYSTIFPDNKLFYWRCNKHTTSTQPLPL